MCTTNQVDDLAEHKWQDKTTQEFRNIALAFFNGEEIFNDDRYEADDWALGKNKPKHQLETQLEVQVADDREKSLSDSSESGGLPTETSGNIPYVSANITWDSDWSKVLRELQAELVDKKELAVFLIDVVLNNKLETAMNPLENRGQKYNGMLLKNMKDYFKAVSESLDKIEEVIEDPEVVMNSYSVSFF